MDFQEESLLNLEKLNEDGRMRHEYVFGKTGYGFGSIGLSKKTTAGVVKGGILFQQDDNEIMLTKEELLNEFKICLETGYFTKEDLADVIHMLE